jgi:hypothetical protein
MSYTRTYRGSASGSKTVTVSYPASEHGGSRSITVNIDVPVNINLSVDTRQFDYSVAHCVGGVQALAGAVAATNTAQVGAIAASAHKVGSSMLGGFFKLIRSELTQQISENKARCEALLLKLNDMKVAVLARKSQMGGDFARIADRYMQLFQDMDRELANRVRAIDGPAFSLREAASGRETRSSAGSVATLATLVAGEENQARTNLGICALRSNAISLLQRASAFLALDRRLNESLRSVLIADGSAAVRDRHLPVLYAEMDLDASPRHQTLLMDAKGFKAFGSAPIQQQLSQYFHQPDLRWIPMDRDTLIRVETFLANQISTIAAEPGSPQARVCTMILDMWRTNKPALLTLAGPKRGN